MKFLKWNTILISKYPVICLTRFVLIFVPYIHSCMHSYLGCNRWFLKKCGYCNIRHVFRLSLKNYFLIKHVTLIAIYNVLIE